VASTCHIPGRKSGYKTLADNVDFMQVDIESCKIEITHIRDFVVIPSTSHMEEDLPQCAGKTKPAEASKINDAVSLYKSGVSAPWTQRILVRAANSIQ
jgi:hypothetical protein